jgi:Kef-type K+ transport system membrane component KefB
VIEHEVAYASIILTVGGLVFLNFFVKSCLTRLGVPALVGFLLLGIGLRAVQAHWSPLAGGTVEVIGFLAKVGLITLLFRVGLESNLRGLLAQLRTASLVWISNVLIAFLGAAAACIFLLDIARVTGLILAVALTATSVGISVAVWEEAGALQSDTGELLLDVAELDDISAIVLMGVIFAVLPHLQDGAAGGDGLWGAVAGTTGLFLARLVAFGLLYLLFSIYAERPITAWFRHLDTPPDFMLVVLALGFVFAALAELVGFSLAIGAFFAGIVFSRDPEAVKREGAFIPLYEFFSPFFFIGIGFAVDPATLGGALGLGSALMVVALATKIVANGLPVWWLRGGTCALLVGVSMVPRAEIAMVIMERGMSAGEGIVPAQVYSAMVLVSIVTCTVAPMAVRGLLTKWPPEGKQS